MLRTGVDLIEIARIQRAIDHHGARFLQRIYTSTEQQGCQGRVESLAARFAAKEATAKALGTGIWRHGVDWTDIEIRRDPTSGAPHLLLYRAAATYAQQAGLTEWSISLSHDRERAIAFVVAMSHK
ncbi:MAG: holo-ACP synthase [Caldilineaceae bacterium]|nr:holo-ACP synthase [Caldilineaceae bacterium]